MIDARIRSVTDKPITAFVDTDYNSERAGRNGYWRGHGAQVISTRLTDKLLRRDWTKVGDLTRNNFPDYPRVALSLPTKTYPGDFPAEQVLYAGNILKEHIGNLLFADIHAYENTLEKLKRLKLPVRFVISGHWEPVHGPELIDRYLGFLHDPSSDKG